MSRYSPACTPTHPIYYITLLSSVYTYIPRLLRHVTLQRVVYTTYTPVYYVTLLSSMHTYKPHLLPDVTLQRVHIHTPSTTSHIMLTLQRVHLHTPSTTLRYSPACTPTKPVYYPTLLSSVYTYTLRLLHLQHK